VITKKPPQKRINSEDKKRNFPMAPVHDPNVVRMALPKGRMFDQVVDLLKGAGVSIRQSERGYRPTLSLPNYDCKILKPRNVISMLHAGARDIGFAGNDWVAEMKMDLPLLYETGLNPVRLVVAAPPEILENGQLPHRPANNPLVIATEYPELTRQWIEQKGLNAEVLHTHGATEVFPPEDADCIVDNTSTGSTLRANGLHIIEDIMSSATCIYASRAAVANPAIKARLDVFVMLLDSVIKARERVMMDLNVAAADLDAVLACLPSMRQPTVSHLSDSDWCAVRSAVPRNQMDTLIPKLKSCGACDIVITAAEQLIA